MRNVGAVVLAAGGSSRLGQPKQLLTFRGETLIRRAVRAALEVGCDPVLVIASDLNETATRAAVAIRDSRIAFSHDDKEVSALRLVVNSEWERGIGTSIRRGVEELPEDVEAVVLLTCDQVFAEAPIIRRLIETQERTGKSIVASSYANTLGVPALFARSKFEALRALPPTAGAKSLITTDPEEVASVAFEEGAIDIDTPEDFERLKRDHG